MNGKIKFLSISFILQWKDDFFNAISTPLVHDGTGVLASCFGVGFAFDERRHRREAVGKGQS